MSRKYTYEQIAANRHLWDEFADPHGAYSDEFDSMSVEQKVQLQIDAFGPEQTEDAGDDE